MATLKTMAMFSTMRCFTPLSRDSSARSSRARTLAGWSGELSWDAFFRAVPGSLPDLTVSRSQRPRIMITPGRASLPQRRRMRDRPERVAPTVARTAPTRAPEPRRLARSVRLSSRSPVAAPGAGHARPHLAATLPRPGTSAGSEPTSRRHLPHVRPARSASTRLGEVGRPQRPLQLHPSVLALARRKGPRISSTS
jgi:hypothetical protein